MPQLPNDGPPAKMFPVEGADLEIGNGLLLELKQNLLTLLFPPKCMACQRELDPSVASSAASENGNHSHRQTIDPASDIETHWCRACLKRMLPQIAACQKCGATAHPQNPFGARCRLCHGLDLRFSQAIAIGNYRDLLQEIVVQMKNMHQEQTAIQLGKILSQRLIQTEFIDRVDCVVPIPTHWWRRFRRGFHAAEILAETVARSCRLPLRTDLLQCLRTTKKQGTLSAASRFKNVAGAFGIRKNDSVRGQTVLVIDDVMTSGATNSEAAKILRRAGAADVYCGVIARGARVS